MQKKRKSAKFLETDWNLYESIKYIYIYIYKDESFESIYEFSSFESSNIPRFFMHNGALADRRVSETLVL